MIYDGFLIMTFEAGRSLWHAKIRRADLKPVIIDGVSFPELEVGFAWSDPDAAIEDAKTPHRLSQSALRQCRSDAGDRPCVNPMQSRPPRCGPIARNATRA